MPSEMNKTGLLVAAPNMHDTFFARTVVLLCDYGDDGAIGVITNRITDVTSEEVLGQMDIEAGSGVRSIVRWGGPVQPGAVFLTFRRGAHDHPIRDVNDDDADEEIEPAFMVTEELRVSPARGIIAAVSEKPSESPGFLTLGYAGWAPGQLDQEIQSGSWILLDADPDIVFDVDPEDQWEHCIQTLGIAEGLLWMHPVEE
jgi:putative transcriptional regulator